MRASGYERELNDWYVEPPWIVEALLKKERFEGSCWDPACGSGNIVRVLRNFGHRAVGSDKFNRAAFACRDFLTGDISFCTCENIISNPPYALLEQFIYKALALAPKKIAFLARLAFLEGQAREKLFRITPLAKVYVSRRRVSMPPGGTDIPAKGGSVAYAWFVWDKEHTGLPQIDWV